MQLNSHEWLRVKVNIMCLIRYNTQCRWKVVNLCNDCAECAKQSYYFFTWRQEQPCNNILVATDLRLYISRKRLSCADLKSAVIVRPKHLHLCVIVQAWLFKGFSPMRQQLFKHLQFALWLDAIKIRPLIYGHIVCGLHHNSSNLSLLCSFTAAEGKTSFKLHRANGKGQKWAWSSEPSSSSIHSWLNSLQTSALGHMDLVWKVEQKCIFPFPRQK